METKHCPRCKEYKPLQMFHRNKSTTDGLSTYCKKCAAELKGHQYTPKEEFPEGYRRCTKCKTLKPLEAFHKTKKGRFGHASVCIVCRSRAQPKPPVREGYMLCYKCGEEKLATPEFFCRSTQTKSGLVSFCRVCSVKAAQEWRKKKLAEDPEYTKRLYWKHRDKNVARSRNYHLRHRDETNRKRREDRKQNPEKYRQLDKESYSKYREQFIENVRQWRKANPERYRLYNRQWAENNPEAADAMIRAAWQRRRARKRNLPVDFTIEDWLYCLDYWNHECAVCGSNENLHADHWIALSADESPGTVADNMVVLCGHCNKTKHATDAVRWLIETFGQEFALQKLAEIEAYFQHVRERKADG
jgi:5-methylcytosine-specific restriction endonuclease McrA